MGKKSQLVNALEQGNVVSGDVAEPVNVGLNLDGLQSAIYQFAGLVGEQRGLARTILGLVPNWTSGNLDKSITERVDRALFLRHKELSWGEYGYVELNGAKQFLCFYRQVNGAIEINEPKLKEKCANVIRVDSDHASSYTGQQFGALKKEDLDKYKVWGEWRKAGLAAPARRALVDAKLYKVSDLRKISLEDLADLHGMGKTAIARLKTLMSAKGIKFLNK